MRGEYSQTGGETPPELAAGTAALQGRW